MALAKPNANMGGIENATRVFPPTKIKFPLDCLRAPIKGQRLPRRARSARHWRGGRWPVAFGATVRIADSARCGQGDGLGQTQI
jgi:hypothetical protein